jgi:uncharacterized membrane protein YidH (DUF202 family)
VYGGRDLVRAYAVGERGLQVERTILAWRRTTLTAACVALPAVRACIVQPSTVWLAMLVLSGLVVGVLAAGTGMRTRDQGREPSGTRAAPRLFMFSISAALSVDGLCVLVSLR